MKLMFVCTANTCRSAMAEAIFKTMVSEDIEVFSAGINAQTGRKASKNTIMVCSENGLDISGHLATNIIDSNISDMDIVLTATYEQKLKILELFDNLVEVYTIKEFAGIYPYDIDDPIGYELQYYRSCFNEIRFVLNKLIKCL